MHNLKTYRLINALCPVRLFSYSLAGDIYIRLQRDLVSTDKQERIGKGKRERCAERKNEASPSE